MKVNVLKIKRIVQRRRFIELNHSSKFEDIDVVVATRKQVNKLKQKCNAINTVVDKCNQCGRK